MITAYVKNRVSAVAAALVLRRGAGTTRSWRVDGRYAHRQIPAELRGALAAFRIT
jgi:hypothetical protein